MGKKTDGKTSEAREEPFFLSMLPFAGLLLLLGFALLWRFFGTAAPASAPAPGESPAKLAVSRWERANEKSIPVAADDFVQGPQDAPVTIVEFSDFQCPYCRAGTSEVRKVLADFGGKVRLVFKNFPLDKSCNDTMTQQLHPYACRAALLARCAGAKDPEMFWRAHDLLFGVSELSDDVLARVPKELSLPPKELQACTTSAETLGRIQRDIREAQDLGVYSTPSFFLNGRQVADYRDGSLGRLVEHVLASNAEASSPSGGR